MTIRLGVIGPGLIWRHSHRQALENLRDRVQVTALCARQQSTLDSAGVPEANRHTEIDGLLRDPVVDAVLVLTPIHLNAPTAIAALNAGKNVFLEKPAGTSVEQCKALLAAESASGKRVCVLEQAAYGQRLATMKRVVAEGRLGDVVLYDRVSHGILDADSHDCGGYGKTSWRQEPQFPLGALFDGGIHEIAELTQLFGVPKCVRASGRKWRSGFGEYDEILMQFTYESGLHGVFSHSAALPGFHSGFTIRGTEGTLRPNGKSLQIADSNYQTRDVPLDCDKGSGMWEQILDAYERGAPAPYRCADAAQDVAILEAASSAVRSGAEEPIAKLAV